VTALGKFYLGLPGWAHKPWRGTLYTRDATTEDYLPQYAQVFNAIEGNTTFYGVPKAGTVTRWAAEAPDSLRFCLKFPKTITHEARLIGAAALTAMREFLDRVAPLGVRLGPFFIQLHDSFGAKQLPELAAFLRALPREHHYAVEVRSPDFFDAGPHERAFEALLGELGLERAHFDTRVVHASTATDEHTLESQSRKPRVPLRTTAIGPRPFVRFVGDPAIETNDAALVAWADIVARWLGEGRTVYFFVHHPNDDFAPQLARRFQAMLHARLPLVPPPAPWPGERETPAQQLNLL
jgi:uncharacterized protein YecE (DUF72 family)